MKIAPLVLRLACGFSPLLQAEEEQRSAVIESLAVEASFRSHVERMSPAVRRIAELACANPRSVPCAGAFSVLADYAELFELLPLERLTVVRIASDELELRFDFGKKDSKRVPLRSRKMLVLEPRDDEDPFAGGKLHRSVADERGLIVGKRLHFALQGDQIASVGKGELELDLFGPVDPDIELYTLRDPGRKARDEKGRYLLLIDAHGQPVLDGSGRYQPLIHDNWVYLRVSGREILLGVGAPRGLSAARGVEAMAGCGEEIQPARPALRR